MNLKLISQKLPQATLALILGLIFYPQSAKATSTVITEDLDLSKPTLLVNSVKEVSLLAKNSSNITTPLTTENVSAIKVDNFAKNNYTLAKNERVTDISEEKQNSREKPELYPQELSSFNSIKSSPSLIASSDNSNTSVKSLPIAVEVPSQTVNNSESISIPIQFENNTPNVNNNTSDVNNKIVANNTVINIPVAPPEIEQQTVANSSEMMKNVEKPTLISNTNTRTLINQNSDRRNISIPAPSANTRTSNSSNLMSSVPIQVEYYNPMITPSAGEMVSPELPQINSPDPYLPDNSRPFTGFIWPAKGVLSSGYGPRWGRMHKGIDIAGPVGTPIVAAADGEVITAGWNSGGFGNLVKIKHLDGTVTLYAHNSRITVRRGQFVTQGQQIANLGNTGFSTGPHLHFEIHPNGGKAMNPMAFLPRKN